VTLTITGHAKGKTTITGTYMHGSNSGTETIEVRVPVTSMAGFLILNFLFGVALIVYLKQNLSRPKTK
jgi:hypothetical protein